MIELDGMIMLHLSFLKMLIKNNQNTNLIFKKDKEDFCIGENRNEKTNMEDLILLKNRIILHPKKKEKEIQTNDGFQIKCKELIILVKVLELIYDNIRVLRIKGSSLSILIIIEIKYPTIKYSLEYSLDKKGVNFEFMIDYLFRAKTG